MLRRAMHYLGLAPDDEYEDDYADDASYDGCDTDDIKKGTVLKSAEIERSGGTTFVVALEFA